MNTRLIGIGLLLGVGACTPLNRSASTRAALEPRNGPHARVYASYTGGLTGRTVRTRFESSRDANVVVGRLGGDGSIEILFPETPRESNRVLGGKTYSARTFEAEYDGVPQLYSYASYAQRSYGAQLNSYDGRGNGFIFIIASEYPLSTEKLDDHGEWSDSLAVDNYFGTFEPRESIRDFADQLAGGNPYTLDYADSFTTQGYTGYAAMLMDCSLLSVRGYFGYGGCGYSGAGCFGFTSLYGLWFGSAFDPFGGYSFSRYSPYAGCGFSYDRAFLNAAAGRTWCLRSPYCYNHGLGNYPRTFIPAATVGLAAGPRFESPMLPTTSPARTSGFATSPRPGQRNGSQGTSSINVTRPRFGGDRTKTTTSTTSWAPPIRPTRTSEDRPTRSWGAAPSNGGTSRSSGNSSGSTSVSRPAPAPSAPATPAASQPAPPPKVAATADAPRKP